MLALAIRDSCGNKNSCGSHTSSTEDVMLVARVGGWAGVAARIGAVAARRNADDCCIAFSHSCGLKCLNRQEL